MRLLLVLLCLCASCTQEVEARPRSLFWVGNSLTWDTRPEAVGEALGVPSSWHIACGKTLPEIVADPEYQCIKGPWWDAAKATDLIVQPHGTGSVAATVAAIEVIERAVEPDRLWVLCTWPTKAGQPQAPPCKEVAAAAGARMLNVGARIKPEHYRDGIHLDKEEGRLRAALAALEGLR